MDIFNRKKIRELEEKLARAQMESNKYRNMAAHLEYRLDGISRVSDNTPEDCKRGHWCAACEFGKVYHYLESYDFSMGIKTRNQIYVCGKGESCKNFIQKEIEE